MNRKTRRALQATYRHMGLTKEQAKNAANQYIGAILKEGDLCRINFNFCMATPEFKLQKDEFRQWIFDHKDETLTVSAVKENGQLVQFEQDEQEPENRYWHKTITLIPLPKATIKLGNGTETVIPIQDINNIEAEVNTKINSVLEE